MKKMILTLDIGNSRIKCAVFEQNRLLEKYVFEAEEALKNFQNIFNTYPTISKTISSSVGKLESKSINFLKKQSEVITVSHQTTFPFQNNYQTPTTLGIDRMVLASGASLTFQNKNCLIIDAGTCITYDFIDDKNTYHGGAISPGLYLRYKSLHTYTAKLPLLTLEMPNNLIGNSTNQAIHSGVVNGVLTEIDGLIEQYSIKYQDLTIILTGGDAEFLAKSLKSTIFANSNFLLESLNELYTYCKKQND